VRLDPPAVKAQPAAMLERTPVPFDPDRAEHVALYDEASLWSAQAGLLLLDHVPLRGRRVLDLGCGAGFPTLELAERLGSDAVVIGVDPWMTALARAQAKRRAWPVPAAAFVRGDGARLPLRDGSIDLVVSNLGVNNFADPETALGECRRVLARDGTLALTTNVEGHFAELYAVMAEVLDTRRDSAAIERLERHVAHRGTIDSLGARLERAGFRVESVHERRVVYRFGNADAIFDHHFMRLGFVPAWHEVAGESAEEVLAEVRGRLDALARETGEIRLTVPLVAMLAHPR
jgi:ubiquinone/menaquinone biosynthesis C-methylase UbiE